ncbi:MAG: class I SAM-dependent methyltransferase [Anaerolineae bacterium]|nr:class I SAM-dependent methyltransferase [Anaerolineae bacterium]
MKHIGDLLKHFLKEFGSTSDPVDPRFRAVRSGNPVEIDVAFALYSLVRLMKANTIVETGTNVGVSTLAMAKALDDDDLPGSKIVTFDVADYGVESLALRFGLQKRVCFYNQSSLESNLQGQLAKVDLLFLDSLPSLLADELAHFWPLLRRSSLIVVHDTRLFGEKREAVDRFLATYRWQSVSTMAGRGLTLLTPGDDGLIAAPPAPGYALIVDSRTGVRRDLVQWPIEVAPEHVTWLGDADPSIEAFFGAASHTIAADLPMAFAIAGQSRATHLLYWNSALEHSAQHLKAAWDVLNERSRPDYATAREAPEIAWNQGGLECHLLMQRWKESAKEQITIKTPRLSGELFFINRSLLCQMGQPVDLAHDPDWFMAATICRLLLVGGTFAPVLEVAAPAAIPEQTNPLAGPKALQAARRFYRQLPAGLQETFGQHWRRFLRVYYFGAGIAPLSWRDVARKPFDLIRLLVHLR